MINDKNFTELNMEKLIIRKAKEEDLPFISKIESKVYSVEGPWSLKDFQDNFAQDNRYYLVAEYEGKIVGYSAATVENDTVNLTMSTVLPEYRDKGIATQFLIKRLEWAGNRRVILQIRLDNTIIQKTYVEYGFEPKQILQDFYPNNVAALEMVRPAIENI
jgi:ribosomal-protein-alanine N-acetyltransferase